MKSYYIKNEVIPFEEAEDVEFKGHRDFSSHNLTCWGKYNRTRQYISKYACGMLNSGQGGTIYMGVLDTGIVGGLMLSDFQRDHVVLNIVETFGKFEPQVPPHLYSIIFKPVLDSEHSGWDLSKLVEHRRQDRNLKHMILNNKYCWCDYECFASFNRGILPPFYIIELRIKRWNGYDPRNKSYAARNGKETLPMFVCEDNQVYIRRNATNDIMSKDEIASRTEYM